LLTALSPRVSWIAVEGNTGLVDLSRYQRFADLNAIRTASDYLLTVHELTGPVHAALKVGDFFPKIIGIADAEHHARNVEAYRRASRRLPKAKDEEARRASEANGHAARVLKGRLAEFRQRRKSYYAAAGDVGPYVQWLLAQTGSAGVPAAAQFE